MQDKFFIYVYHTALVSDVVHGSIKAVNRVDLRVHKATLIAIKCDVSLFPTALSYYPRKPDFLHQSLEFEF